jgi:hypothetical protein
VGQILDLVDRYGTTPIGETGFIVQYIQGLQVYEKARARHRALGEASGKVVDEPAATPDLVNSYRQAAELLRLALASADAPRFAGEAARAMMRRGFALYYAGDLEEASLSFQKSHEVATGIEARRDGLWYAIVALDHAVEAGRVSLAKERDRLAVLFLQQFPQSEDAARLLLRQAQAELLSDEDTLKILMSVTPEQPLYEASRRQAARVLYRMYRRSPQADRGFAAIRFADVAEEILRLETRRAQEETGEEAVKAAQNVLLLVRQLADALLSGPAPDVKRVESALQLMEAVAGLHRLDLASLEAELAFRRLQVAMAREDEAEIERCVLRLRQNTGEFALAGERLMYRRALARWSAAKEDAALAERVVRHGRTILENSGGAKDSSMASVRVSVAAAAAALWEARQDAAMRDLAITLDKESVEAGGRTAAVLRRLADLSESAGDTGTALSSWQMLFAALPVGEPDWYEARYQSLRLLWETDKAAAVAAMGQFRAMYPKMGPEPWRTPLVELERKMGGFAPPASSPKGSGGKGGGP